jgi:hypothetical protein
MVQQNTAAPQTDQNGNPLPPQGVAPGAATPGIVANSGGLADAVAAAFMKHLAANQPPPVSAVIAKAKADADAAQPVKEDNPPAPGSFGSKLISAAQGVAGDLGDAAHASDTKGGWLTGVTNTLNARNQRLAQQKKDEALLAKSQAETVALHRNIYQQDEAIRQNGYKGNQAFVDTFKAAHDVEEGLTHDELMKRATSDKDFAKKYFVRATSETPVLDANGVPTTDKNGNPVMTPSYAVITQATKDGSPDDKVVTPDMSADMKKYLGSQIPPNTRLTGLQYYALDGKLNLTRNAVNILNNTNEKELTDEQVKSLNPYLTDPTIQGAISHVPGSAYAGLLQYQKNADAHIADLQQKADQAKQQNNQKAYDTAKQQIADVTQEKDKVAAFAAQAITPKQIERYDKEGEKDIQWVDKVLHDPNALSGDKASAVIPQLQSALATATDPGLKQKLTTALATAINARNNYFNDMSRKARADQAAKQGDPAAAGRDLAAGLLTLADLKTRGTTADFILQATDYARKINKDYNPADEVNFEHIAKSPSAAQFFGSARSLMEKGGTLDQLLAWGKKIPDNGLPAINSIEDWEKLKTGKGPLAGYAALVLGAADDYGKVMGGGAASDSARDSALRLFAAAATQEQREDAVRATHGGVGSQFDSRIGKNKFLQREYNDFARSSSAPTKENPTEPAGQQSAAATTKQPASGVVKPAPQATRPADCTTCTGAAPDPKTGTMYWHDAAGRVVRAVKPGELPNE